MAVLFRWLAALNVVGTVAVVLSVLAGPSLFTYLFLPSESVEIQLIPLEPVRLPALVPAPSARLEVPPQFRAPDLASRPWDELPDGRVRMRD